MPQSRDEDGNIWETDAQGNVVGLLQAAPPKQPPVNPDYQVNSRTVEPKIREATAQANRAEIGITGDRVNIEDTRADNARADKQMAAELYKEGLEIGPDGKPRRIEGWKPITDDKPIDPMKSAQFGALQSQIDRVEELYRAGPGSTSGLKGISDYFPSDANSAFDAASAGLGEVGLAAFRVPGVGSQSDTELRQFVAANTPSASDRDAAIEEKLGNLKRRLAATQSAIGGSQMTAAPFGSTTGAEDVPSEMVAENNAWLQQNLGKASAADYVAFAMAQDKKYGLQSDSPDSYAKYYEDNLKAVNQGGQFNPNIEPREVPLSGLDQLRNDAVNNPVGAGLTSFADAMSFGAPSAMAGDQMAALRESQPISSTLGQIGGTIGGVGLIGKGAKQGIGAADDLLKGLISKRSPGLFGGGKKAQMGRDLAADVGYSGIYGANTEQGVLESMALGGIGSAGGQAIGALGGAALKGVDFDPAVDYLRSRGIPLTGGQTAGGLFGRAEERAISMPGVGDVIRNRRIESIQGLNKEAFNQAGSPIGATITRTGKEGLEDLESAVEAAYTRATSGMNAPLDGQFAQEMQTAIARGQNLPPDLKQSLGEILSARVAPVTDTGAINGQQFQQIRRALTATRNNPPQRFQGFEDDYRESITGVLDAVEGQVIRGSGQQNIDALLAANKANRNLRTLEDATNRAKGGSLTETPFEFSANQLQSAGVATNKKYPGGQPFEELADAGAKVLPNRLPNSQSADRLMQAGLLGSVATGTGAGYLAGGDAGGAAAGAAVPTGAMILAMLGGTKTGQKTITKLMRERPELFSDMGRGIINRTGMFGSAGVGLTVP